MRKGIRRREGDIELSIVSVKVIGNREFENR